MWTYALAGRLDFEPGGILGAGPAPAAALWVLFGLFVVGMGVKAAIVPLHTWLPVAMIAPTPVSALLHAVAVVKAGIFGFVRLVDFVFGADLLDQLGAASALAALAGATILLGSQAALARDNLKRLLAFSTISHLFYVILGAAIGTPEAFAGGVFHIASHALLKITLFFCAGAIYATAHVERVILSSTLLNIAYFTPIIVRAFSGPARGPIAEARPALLIPLHTTAAAGLFPGARPQRRPPPLARPDRGGQRRGRPVTREIRGLIGLAAMLTVAEITLPASWHVPPGITALFSALGCVAIVLLSKALGAAPAALRRALLLAPPAVAIAMVWVLPEGAELAVSVMGQELILARVDRLGRLFALIGGLGTPRRRLHCGAFVATAAAMGIALAGNWVTLYVAWETLAVASFVLILDGGTPRARSGAFHYLLVHFAGGACLLGRDSSPASLRGRRCARRAAAARRAGCSRAARLRRERRDPAAERLAAWSRPEQP